jgi:anti-sigma factor RsiW
MNKCTELDIQEMLPDLLHGALGADARAQVEAHIASCEDCAEELQVLRTVKSGRDSCRGLLRQALPWSFSVAVRCS